MKRGAFAVLAVIVGAGILMRWWALGDRSLWFDEGYTQWTTTLSLSDLIRAIRFDYTPPLYFMLVRWWTWIWGDSELALRSWSALVASLSIVLVAMIAWRTTRNSLATAIATALFAASEIQLEWGQTARAYATASFVFVLSAWLLIRYLDTANRWWLVAYSLAAALLVYQHNVMWFFLVGLHAGALLWPGPLSLRQRLGSLALADVVVAVCFAPWVPGFLQQVHQLEAAYFTERPVFYDLSQVVVQQVGIHVERLRELSGHYLGIEDGAHRLYRLGFFALAVGLGLAALLRRPAEMQRRVLAIMAFGALPLAIGFVYSNVRTSIWVEKSMIPASTMLPIMIAAALAGAWKSPVRVGLALASGIVVVAALVTSIDYLAHPPLEDWHEATCFIGANEARDTGVVFVGSGGEMLYRYYAQREKLPLAAELCGLPSGYFSTDPPIVMTRIAKEPDTRKLLDLMQSHRVSRIVLLQAYTKWADARGLAQGELDHNWRLIEAKDCGKVTARLYGDPVVFGASAPSIASH